MFDFGCFLLFPKLKKSESNFIGLDSEVYQELGRFAAEEISLPDRSFLNINDPDSGLTESQNFIDRIFEFHKTEETGISGIFDETFFSKEENYCFCSENIEENPRSGAVEEESHLAKRKENFSILTKEIKCGFCEGRNHFPEDCTGFTTFSERIKKFQSHQGTDCFFCGSNKKPCHCPSRCGICFGRHHIAICSRGLASEFKWEIPNILKIKFIYYHLFQEVGKVYSSILSPSCSCKNL